TTVEQVTGGDKVIFLQYSSKQVRGLKLSAIQKIKALHAEYNFLFAVGHRFKPLYICTLVPGLRVVGVDHAFGDFVRWSRRLFIWAFSRKINLMAVSKAVAEDVNKDLASVGFNRCAVQYNHLDFDAVIAAQKTRAQARMELGLAAERYYLLNVGRLHPDKDQATLIRAFAAVAQRLPDTDLVILGKGKLEQALKALAEELGVAERVRFLGFVNDARSYFRGFDSFILSSDYEPFGMVLLEAIAADLPFAVTDCGGAKEIAELCGGIKFEWKNTESAAQAILQLRKQPAPDKGAALAHFSPQAARAQFFALPFVSEWLAGEKANGSTL
ncbi:MAG TPA: glycosyltransferase, partial [Pseudomonadales bacterium]|nr:glycosyltransferase [Pseudomonadales bacterium]